jgi:radical SAM superfamily enzyme YgiQ (UPF0313 family)
MNVLLISANTAASPYPVYPLGCALLSASLADAGHAVRLLDAFVETPDLAWLDRAVAEFRPDAIGISIRNLDNVNLLGEQTYLGMPRRLVGRLRELCREVPVILGGSGFSLLPEAVMAHVGGDYGIVGEGERLLPELLATLAAGRRPVGRILRSSQALAGSAVPAAVFDPGLTAAYRQAGAILPVQTKRGCANRCRYCTYPFLEGRALRVRPPAEVLAEMRRLRDAHGADFVFFTDSVFNDRDGAYLELVAALERDPVLPWTAFFQPDPGLTPILADRLVAAGLHAVELGADAATDATLAALGKDFDFAAVRRVNDLLAERNIPVANYFMLGGPGETRETAIVGVDNLRSLGRSVSFVFLGIRILPGTGLHGQAIQEGLVAVDDDLLAPVYYLSPQVDRAWLEEYLGRELGRMRHCIYPPDAMENGVRVLRQMGYRGNLWELLLRKSPGNAS